MQVPINGTILIPTLGKPQPLTMSTQDNEVAMDIHPRHIEIPIQGNNRFKISLDALQSVGRFGYLRKLNEEDSSLLIRQFQVHTASYYPDYPSGQLDHAGSCMQFFYDGCQMGGFAELEYHVPAIRYDGTSGASVDASQVYYFVGKTEKITKVIEQLLGIILLGGHVEA